MRRDDGGLQDVVLVGDVADGLKELLRVLNEGDERAEREQSMLRRVAHHAPAAVPDNQRDADGPD